MMTVAAIDRIVHHVNLIEVRADDSYRRKAAMQRMGSEQAASIAAETASPDKTSTEDQQEDRTPA